MGRAFEVRKVAMAKTAAAKSKVYSKFGREIYMAAKSGTPDPETNQTLKRVIERAKKEQVTADIIKRAIDKAKGGSDENYTEIRYEGFGPGNSLIIVECLTDNTNRTLSDVRTLFNKAYGKLGVSGSVLHQFEHRAVFEVKATEDQILEVLLENDINVLDVEVEDEFVTIYAEPSEYGKIGDTLKEVNLEPTQEMIAFLPMTTVEIKDADEFAKFERLVNGLDELDDVSNVYHNVVIEN
ncbi:Probable transcriptional regulatory protein SAV0669 [Acholeplasma oculi]|uniref:Probable transcriptional regulatory protein Aocu_14090 n=1 Tax=Acholeplasma oculi TaxID=35623 RepID=A0A061AKB8_9MOLU|nr:YebC/PmpR family DNA-binding transcriptional regulator [Acholeplasma oculi]CDR31482.1 Probable transcriptional regulatory protein YebC [Acholeplasma oculi]SKC49246.1 DNA-binding regulatory protein, YebC/PmpR family [Acholeplasma oculi]SUT92206.1 Probable transcriptional regulatory protein SAV0669 [Acholeplasma oculi]